MSTSEAYTKRHSTTSTSTKEPPSTSPPLTHHPSALLSDKAQLVGAHAITLHPNCIVHPFARLDATHGPVEIGPGAVVWEAARVGVSPAPATSSGPADPRATRLGRYAVVEAMAVVACGCTVGDHSSVEVGAALGSGVSVGAHCRVAPKSVVADGAVLPDYTVVFYGSDGGEGWGEEEQRWRRNETVGGDVAVRQAVEKNRENHVEVLKQLVKGRSGGG